MGMLGSWRNLQQDDLFLRQKYHYRIVCSSLAPFGLDKNLLLRQQQCILVWHRKKKKNSSRVRSKSFDCEHVFASVPTLFYIRAEISKTIWVIHKRDWSIRKTLELFSRSGEEDVTYIELNITHIAENRVYLTIELWVRDVYEVILPWVEFLLKFTSNNVRFAIISGRIIKLCVLKRSLWLSCHLKVVYTRASSFFNNFNFLKLRNRKCPTFNLLRNLIIHLIKIFLHNFGKTKKNVPISYTTYSHCITMAIIIHWCHQLDFDWL